VPGNASPEGAELAGGIAAVASKSCPGVPVLAGYMTGREQSLTSVLARCRASDGRLGAVVVPLLICAQPAAEAAIAAAVAQSGAHALMAGPLGVHPLLAGALHARLAESGLARSDRIGRISIATPADGVLVAATGDDAVSAAGTLAVLLAGRLAVPVAPASFSDRASLADGVTRLREAGVSRMALAPCIIGPETWPVELAEVSGQYALHPAAPLGSHDAVGQMAAVRYGTVLQDPQLAGLPG
jgi:sirohydrochlorin ferrochelatase